MTSTAYRIRHTFTAALLGLGLLCSTAALANSAHSAGNTIYGWQLMSHSEREHFRFLYALQTTAEDKKNFLYLHMLKMQYREGLLHKPASRPVNHSERLYSSRSGRVQR